MAEARGSAGEASCGAARAFDIPCRLLRITCLDVKRQTRAAAHTGMAGCGRASRDACLRQTVHAAARSKRA